MTVKKGQKNSSDIQTTQIYVGTYSDINSQKNKVQTVLKSENEYCELSVVCIDNNRDILKRFLFPSVEKQINVNYELKIIENYQNEYGGARLAFNEVAKELQGEYVMFVHNDFNFSSEVEFRKIINFCRELESFGVVGVAGCDAGKKKLIRTRIKQGTDRCSVGKTIDEPISVMSVDECCFVIKRSRFITHPFESKGGWHLYAVEYCLKMLDEGLQNYVIPIEAWHYSDGVSLNAAYCREVKILLEKYSDQYDYINTTVKQWKTDWFTREVYLRYYAMKQNIKARIIKK